MRYARPALHQEKQNIRIGNSRKQNCAESRNFFSSQFRPNSSRWSNVIATGWLGSKLDYHTDRVVGSAWFPYVLERSFRAYNSQFPCELHNSHSPNLTNNGTPVRAKESLVKAENAILPLDNIAFLDSQENGDLAFLCIPLFYALSFHECSEIKTNRDGSKT